MKLSLILQDNKLGTYAFQILPDIDASTDVLQEIDSFWNRICGLIRRDIVRERADEECLKRG